MAGSSPNISHKVFKDGQLFLGTGNSPSLIRYLDSATNGFGGVAIDQAKHSVHVMSAGGNLDLLNNITKMGTPDLSSKPTMVPSDGSVSGKVMPCSENACACTRPDALKFGTMLPIWSGQVLWIVSIGSTHWGKMCMKTFIYSSMKGIQTGVLWLI